MNTLRLHFEKIQTKFVSPGKTKENKKAFEFNLEMLGDLLMRDP
jgi:hypothetical protein